MPLLAQTAVLGILMGGVYALMALGLTLIFGVSRIANFAHGAFYVLGGYAAFAITSALGAPAFVGVIAAAVAGLAAGYLTSALFLRPLTTNKLDRPGEYALIVTFALALLIPAVLLQVFGGRSKQLPSFWEGTVRFGTWVSASGDRIVAFAAAAALISALLVVIKTTHTGRAWRALSQSQLGAQVVGINARALSNLSFAVAGGLAGVSAALVAPILTLTPASGEAVLSASFIAVIIGGLGSIYGSLAGGLILGLTQAFGSVYISGSYAEVYGFAVMAIVLLIRPTGLFGQKVRLV